MAKTKVEKVKSNTPIYDSMPNRTFVEKAMKRPKWDTKAEVAKSYKGKKKV
jgi:hypothetical protein